MDNYSVRKKLDTKVNKAIKSSIMKIFRANTKNSTFPKTFSVSKSYLLLTWKLTRARVENSTSYVNWFMTENCVVVVDLIDELVVHYTKGLEIFGQKKLIVYDSIVSKSPKTCNLPVQPPFEKTCRITGLSSDLSLISSFITVSATSSDRPGIQNCRKKFRVSITFIVEHDKSAHFELYLFKYCIFDPSHPEIVHKTT